MHLFDPQRPRLPVAEREQYLDQNGRVCAVVPSPDVEPNPDGTFTIRAMLKVGHNGFGWFRCDVEDASEISQFFTQWVADPERTMRERMLWKGVSDHDRITPRPETKHQSQPQLFPRETIAVSEDDI